MAGQNPGKENGWSVEPAEATGTIRLSGEVAFSSVPAIRERLLALASTMSGDVTLEMGAVEYLDSSGLALLIELGKRLTENGRTLRIATVSNQVRKLLILTELASRFGLDS